MVNALEKSTLRDVRAGRRVLALLERPLNCLIVQALGARPLRLAELLSELGGPAQTTLRARLAELAALGVVVKRSGGMPYAVEHDLSDAGRDFLRIVESLESWLARAPAGPIPLGSVAARGAIKALVAGWDSTMLKALAARPLSLTQLDGLIGALSYPALERRLSALRVTGLVEPVPDGTLTPYRVSHWARQGIGPLAAAARFEWLHLGDDALALAPLDIEATLRLAAPIARMPSAADGVCQLVAHSGAEPRRRAGVRVAVDRGRVIECVSSLEAKPRNWALASPAKWLEAVVACDLRPLRLGGDSGLAHALVLGIHEALFQGNGHGPRGSLGRSA